MVSVNNINWPLASHKDHIHLVIIQNFFSGSKELALISHPQCRSSREIRYGAVDILHYKNQSLQLPLVPFRRPARDKNGSCKRLPRGATAVKPPSRHGLRVAIKPRGEAREHPRNPKRLLEGDSERTFRGD